MVTSGASGPDTISKQLSNKAWALSSAIRINSTEAKGSPACGSCPNHAPTVMLLKSPGSRVKGPAAWMNRVGQQRGCRLFARSMAPLEVPPVPHWFGSVLPGIHVVSGDLEFGARTFGDSIAAVCHASGHSSRCHSCSCSSERAWLGSPLMGSARVVVVQRNLRMPKRSLSDDAIAVANADSTVGDTEAESWAHL